MATIVDDRNLGFALGAAEYMTKPIDRKRLLEVLNRYRGAGAGDILIVDDDPDVREILVRALGDAGWSVRAAENGQVALDEIHKEPPSVVILDLMMPVMDGFEFLHELRAEEGHHDLPVIVVTARELNEKERRTLSGTVERVIQKGAYSKDDLLKYICRLIHGVTARADS
jgi:CheY-like chemotaxis protein